MQVCVSVMRASTIDRDWKLTKRTAREREKDRERASERERVVREEKDVHASSPFPSYSARTPALLSVSHKFFHMMTRFAVSSNPPDCRWMTSLAAATRFFVTYKNVYLKHTHRQTHTHATVSVILRFVVYVCARACVRVDPARRAAPSLLFVTLDWNAYSQSLHCWHSPADVTHPLIHNIVSATRRCVEAGGKRVRSPSKVRNGAWRIALFWLSSSNPSPSAFWTPSLPPLHTMLSPGPPSPLSWMQRENYD